MEYVRTKLDLPQRGSGDVTSHFVGSWEMRSPICKQIGDTEGGEKSTGQAIQNLCSLPKSSPLATPTPWVGLLIRLLLRYLRKIHLPRWGRLGIVRTYSITIWIIFCDAMRNIHLTS